MVQLRRLTPLALAVGAALLLQASVLLAQTETATISGRITDLAGEVVAGAEVRLTHADTGVDSAVESNLQGIYVVRHLPPGTFRLTVRKHGFRTIVVGSLKLAVQDVLGRNFTMQVGTVSDSVTVIGTGGQSVSPAVSTVVDRQLVEHMPLNGRSFQPLIHLAPGVLVTASGQGMEGQFSANGQRTNTNYFTVDGVTVNFGTTLSVGVGQSLGGSLPALTVGGGTNSYVSVDAMEEFRTQTSTYSPELGRTPGAQIAIVTRSGTNRVHGTAHESVRNEAFDARNWFNRPPQPQPPLRQHAFGGTVGGPVAKNRSFFFASYEGLRLEQPQLLTGRFYTAETRAAVAPVYQPIVNAFAVPGGPPETPACAAVSRPCLATVTSVHGDPTRFDASSLRLDHAATPRIRLFVRGSYTPSSTTDGSFASLETSRRDTGLLTAGATAVLGASLVNDLRINVGRSGSLFETTIDDAFGAQPPAIDMLSPPAGGPTPLLSYRLPDGPSLTIGRRLDHVARQFAVVDTFSWVRGAHQVRFGLDYRRMQTESGGRALFLLILTSFDQLRSGTMGTVATSVVDPVAVQQHNWSLFAQDSWSATPRLTVTYGLRWEINTAPASITPGRPLYALEGIFDSKPLQLAPAGTPLWRTRYDEVAPRLGAAYRLTSTTIVRGGSGLFHDLGYGRLLESLIDGFPYRRDRVVSAAGQPFDVTNPAFEPAPFSTALSSLRQGNLAAFDPDLRLPVTWGWNAAVEQQLRRGQSLALTYVGASGSRLLRPDFVVPPESRPLNLPPVATTRNAGRSRYHALQAQWQQRLTRGLQALASYTWASARDTESDDGGGNFLGAAINANSAASLRELPVPPMTAADFDVRHAVAAAISYELPSPSWGKVGRAVFRDWAVDGLVRASSARPLNVRIEGVSLALGVYRTQPDTVAGQPVWLDAPDEPGDRILNPDAFTLPADGTAGTFTRNSIRSPFAIRQTDVALRRAFPLRPGVSLEFRAEFFNVFNHPMFGGTNAPATFWGRCATRPCTGQQSPAFGRVLDQTLNESLGGDPIDGGQSAIYAIGGPRSGQFTLKLRF